MNDKELAGKLVAMGFLRWFETPDGHDGTFVVLPGVGVLATDKALCYWPLAGALMEKWPTGITYCQFDDGGWVAVPKKGGPWIRNDNLPRAIIEACCEALEGTSE